MSVAFPGKSAPRLLQDLCEYNCDANYLDFFRVAGDISKCDHVFSKNNDRSNLPTLEDEKPKGDSKWAIALTCQKCRIHLDIAIIFNESGAICPSSKEAPLHHFCATQSQSAYESQYPRHYKFRCSYEFCRAELFILVRQPVITREELHFLNTTSRSRLHALPNKGGKNNDPLQVLRQYVLNALSGKGKRIPAGNEVFKACLGVEMSDLLTKIGFEWQPDVDAEGWDSPIVPPHDARTLNFDKQRRVLEDAREELNLTIAKTSSAVFLPPPSKRDLEHILGCFEFDTVHPTRRFTSVGDQDNQYNYRVLGALPDFSDDLIDWAFNKQALNDVERRPLYLQSLSTIAEERASEQLSIKAMTLASQGDITQGDLEQAYRTIGIDPSHIGQINDQMILSTYRGRYPDSGTAQKEQMRLALKSLGDYRGSKELQDVAQDNLETYEQALLWLGIDSTTDHEFVWASKIAKDVDPASKSKNTRAVELIQQQTNSILLAGHLQGEDNAPSQAVDPVTRQEALNILGIELAAGETLQDVDKDALLFEFVDQDKRPVEYRMAVANALDHINQVLKDESLGDLAQGLRRGATQVDVVFPIGFPRGLNNIGNTCYMNSLLQLLYTIKPVRELAKTVKDIDQDRGHSGSNADKIRQLGMELGKFFEALTSERANDVTPEKRLAEAMLDRDTESIQEAENAKRRRSTIGTVSRPSLHVTLPSTAEQDPEPLVKVSSPEMMRADEAGDGTRRGVEGEEARSKETTQEMMGDAQATSPTRQQPEPMESNIMQMDQPESSTTLGEHQPDFTVNQEAHIADEDDREQVRKIELWAQQNDMREILDSAYQRLARLALSVARSGLRSDQPDLRSLFWGKEKYSKYDDGSWKEVETQSFNFINLSPNANLNDTHSIIENGYGARMLEFDGKPSPTITTFSDLPPILQFQITSPPNYTTGLPVVEERISMGRYSDDEAKIEQRRPMGKTIAKLDTLHLRLDSLNSISEDPSDSAPTTFDANATEAKKGTTADDLATLTSNYLSDIAPDSDPTLYRTLQETCADLQDMVSSFIPEHASLTQQIALEEAEQTTARNSLTTYDTDPAMSYRLHAVCLHHGRQSTAGHYSIYIFDSIGGRWFYYNDEKVESVQDTSPIFHPEKLENARPALLVYVREGEEWLVETVHRLPRQESPPPPRPEQAPPYEGFKAPYS